MANLSDRLQDAFLVESGEPSSTVPKETDITVGEFVDRLETIAEAAEKLLVLQSDLRALRDTGLTDEDVVALLYGRNSRLNKGDIRRTISTLDDIGERLRGTPENQKQLLKRLVSSLERSLKLDDIEETFDQLKNLHDEYT